MEKKDSMDMENLILLKWKKDSMDMANLILLKWKKGFHGHGKLDSMNMENWIP